MVGTSSPYSGADRSTWPEITQRLVREHPLDAEEIRSAVLDAWTGIFSTTIGRNRLKIGEHIFPKPQIIGALLHELVPAEFALKSQDWRAEKAVNDKDIVYVPDDRYSIELKTSSNPIHIFGNRSYAQAPSATKKGKDGYYIAINFEKVSEQNPNPSILIIRFGWLDHFDWIGQHAQSGQQSRLAPETYANKFVTLYAKS